MAGASKKRQQRERKGGEGSESDPSSPSRSSGPASESQSQHARMASSSQASPLRRSPPRYDGNRDPEAYIEGAGGVTARDPNTSGVIVDARRLDLASHHFTVVIMDIFVFRKFDQLTRDEKYDVPTDLPKRPAANKTGKEIVVGLNTFNIAAYPTKAVYQYDVIIGNGAENRGLIKHLWQSKAVREALGAGWIFDGNRIAWSMVDKSREIRITVDLDDESGRPTRPGGRENKHKVQIRQTNSVRFDALCGYLSGQAAFDNACLEAINFLDHLMREQPSQTFTQIKRSFFARGQQRFTLGGGIEAFKGVYQSIRAVHSVGGARLSVNVDVANGTFWTESSLHIAAKDVCRARDLPQLVALLKGEKETPAFRALRRLRKLRVYGIHRGAAEKEHLFTIDRFLNKSSGQHTFEQKDRTTGISKKITIYDYFAQRYNQRLQFPDLPVVQMTKKNVVLPMELCKLAENQRYVYKLDERQTSNMIKFAVTPPGDRWAAVEHGLGMLDWRNDKYLHSFGLQIDPTQVKVKGRLLPNPKGRGAADKAQVENFIKEFIKVYTGHGGRIENKTPVIIPGQGGDAGKAVEELWNKTGNASQLRPQMLVFIVPDKDTMTYNRIKKSCECRYGVVSQVMQAAHVQKCQVQYISNVCMKFNAKLGGVTARAAGKPSGNFPAPTLVIGADVSHAAPGSEIASMAAITVSTDALATRYAAACETNGHRVEMISTNNITTMLKPQIQNWVQTVGKGKFPERIYYFRDGVSDGQYQHVLQQEVHDMKELLRTAGQTKIKFTVLVASKRHHVRIFPKAGDSAADRNGNPLPGTLVETGVTHPFEYDFYLCAHAALKGTARPVHYHVLLDENKLTVEELQGLIYEHSYQYIRSTTPVSLFPAVYYAHLASNRARSHENAPSSSGPESKGGSGNRSGGSSSDKPLTEAKPLIEMPNNGEIRTSM
ncbi:hypothetical protein B0A49_11611, partial [Cryomyces minteri]